MRKSSLFFFRISFFRISKEQLLKERSIYAYIRTNEFFLSKQISKERQTNFERTLFDQMTYPAMFGQFRLSYEVYKGENIENSLLRKHLPRSNQNHRPPPHS